ncbi:MAG: 16S rRNA (uracil(1498)-N(3))-methyltransferase [Candidatus Limimorpha sp.]
MNVFYLPNAEIGMVSFSEEESKHCVKVLRMQEGDRFCVTDGKGSLFDAELVDAHPKRAVACLSNQRPGYDNRDFKLEIAMAPTKNNERTEWFLEKATEIGVDRVRLFKSFHSERREANVERFRKVMVSAVKQSIKSNLPDIDDVVSFSELISQPFDGQKFIAWIDDGVKIQLCDAYKKGNNALVLIGPEGDFTKEEVDSAVQNGFVPVSLGEARLRTETAAVVSCHTINLINQMGKSL